MTYRMPLKPGRVILAVAMTILAAIGVVALLDGLL